jgi:hypothetical protein
MAVSSPQKAAELIAPRVVERRAVIKVLTGPEAGRVHILATDNLVVGRGANCDLRLEESSLSRQHCRIY